MNAALNFSRASALLRASGSVPSRRTHVCVTRSMADGHGNGKLELCNDVTSPPVPSRASSAPLEAQHPLREPLGDEEQPIASTSDSTEVADEQTRRKLSPAARARISTGLRRRWKLPGHREKVSSSLKDKEPWNKGLKLSEETRAKMSAAHSGRKFSKATRAKMAKAKRGHTLSEESRAKLSAAKKGREMSPEHRAKMAAAMRRRHAAAAVLKAIEQHIDQGEVFQVARAGDSPAQQALVTAVATPALSTVGGGEPPSVSTGTLSSWSAQAPSPPTTMGSSPVHTTGGPSSPLNAGGLSVRLSGMTGGGSGLKGSKPKIGTVLDQYKTLLREYRALQEELQPWTAAFVERHGRKPRLTDVEATKVEWLINKFKYYTVVREKILSDTSRLRDNMSGAAPEPLNPFNGNAPPAQSPSEGAARMMAALEYKAKKNAAADVNPSGAGAKGGETPAEPAALPPTVLAANERVKAALAAALNYRKKKAALTAETLQKVRQAELEKRAGTPASAPPIAAAAPAADPDRLDFAFDLPSTPEREEPPRPLASGSAGAQH